MSTGIKVKKQYDEEDIQEHSKGKWNWSWITTPLSRFWGQRSHKISSNENKKPQKYEELV